MASSSSSNRPAAPGRPAAPPPAVDAPTLLPHGKHRGKPGMTLTRPFTLAGARNRAHLHLVSSSVSKCHAAIVHDNGRVYIRDLSSRTHVYVNGRVIHEMELADGDLLQIGSFTFKLQHPTGGAEVPSPPPGQLVESNNGGGVLPLEGRTTVIGRRSGCDLHIDDESVSTIHAIIFELDGMRYVRDLGSRTGTFVNGIAAHQQPLNFNDRLRVGPKEFIYRPAATGSGTFEDISELEDLVGTARLGHDELLGFTSAGQGLVEGGRQTVAEPGVPADEGETTDPSLAGLVNGHAAETYGGIAEADLVPLADDDDLIPLAPEPSRQPAAPVAPVAPPAPPEPIDLDADEMSGSGTAADTVGLPAPAPAAAAPPTISPMVEDFASLPVAETPQAESETDQFVAEEYPPAGTSTDLPIDDDFFAELQPEQAAEAAPIADWPEAGDLLPTEPTSQTVEQAVEQGDTVFEMPVDEIAGDAASGGLHANESTEFEAAPSAEDSIPVDADPTPGAQSEQTAPDEAANRPADVVEFPEMEDLGMSAHVIGVMPAQWASGPEATPLAVGPEDVTGEATLAAPIDEPHWTDFEQSPGEPAFEPTAEAAPALPMPRYEMPEPATQNAEAPSETVSELPPIDAATAAAPAQDEVEPLDWDSPEPTPDDETPASPAAQATSEAAEIQSEPTTVSATVDSADLDVAEIEAGDIDPSLTEIGIFESDPSVIGVGDIDPDAPLEADVAPAADTGITGTIPTGTSTLSGAADDNLFDFDEPAAPSPANEPASQSASTETAVPTHHGDDSGLDFIEETHGHNTSPAAGNIGAVTAFGGASAAVAPTAASSTGVAAGALGVAAVTAAGAAAIAQSTTSVPPSPKRSIWSRLFGRKGATEPTPPTQPTAATPPRPTANVVVPVAVPSAQDVHADAELVEAMDAELEALPVTPEDSSMDLGQSGDLSWPPKSATITGAGVLEDPHKPSTAASTVDAAPDPEPVLDFETPADAGNVSPSFDESTSSDVIAAGSLDASNAPEESSTVERLLPTIGVAEITLSGIGGHGGQLVLSGAGPVEQLWGIATGPQLDLSSPGEPSPIEAAPPADSAQPERSFAFDVPSGDLSSPGSDSLSSTPMPAIDAASAAVSTDLPPDGASGLTDELPDGFFEELIDSHTAATPTAAAGHAEPAAEANATDAGVTNTPAGQPESQLPVPAADGFEAQEPPQPEAEQSFQTPTVGMPQIDPFAMMGRDQGSFFGGMPLSLGSMQPQAPARPSRPRLPFGDRPVTMETRGDVLAEVTMVEPEAMPMFGAPLPPGVRDETPFKPFQSDLVPLPAEEGFESPMSSRHAAEPTPAAPVDAPLPAGGMFANAADEMPRDMLAPEQPIPAAEDQFEHPSQEQESSAELPGDFSDTESTALPPEMPQAGESTLADDGFSDLLEDLQPPQTGSVEATQAEELSIADDLVAEESSADATPQAEAEPATVVDEFLPDEGLILPEAGDPLSSGQDLTSWEMPLKEPAAEDPNAGLTTGITSTLESLPPSSDEAAVEAPSFAQESVETVEALEEPQHVDADLEPASPEVSGSTAPDVLDFDIDSLSAELAGESMPSSDDASVISNLPALPPADSQEAPQATAADVFATEPVTHETAVAVNFAPEHGAAEESGSTVAQPETSAVPAEETPLGDDWHVSEAELLHDEPMAVDPSEPPFVAEHVEVDSMSLLPPPLYGEEGIATTPVEPATEGLSEGEPAWASPDEGVSSDIGQSAMAASESADTAESTPIDAPALFNVEESLSWTPQESPEATDLTVEQPAATDADIAAEAVPASVDVAPVPADMPDFDSDFFDLPELSPAEVDVETPETEVATGEGVPSDSNDSLNDVISASVEADTASVTVEPLFTDSGDAAGDSTPPDVPSIEPEMSAGASSPNADVVTDETPSPESANELFVEPMPEPTAEAVSTESFTSDGSTSTETSTFETEVAAEHDVFAAPDAPAEHTGLATSFEHLLDEGTLDVSGGGVTETPSTTQATSAGSDLPGGAVLAAGAVAGLAAGAASLVAGPSSPASTVGAAAGAVTPAAKKPGIAKTRPVARPAGASKPGLAKPVARPAKPAAGRPAAAPGTAAPLAKKLDKPTGPRRVIAAKPASTPLTTGFRPPVTSTPKSLGTPAPQAGATPSVRRPMGSPVTPAGGPAAVQRTSGAPLQAAQRRNTTMPPAVAASRDPFTNTGDLSQPAVVAAKPSKRRLMFVLIAVVLTVGAIVAVWLFFGPKSTVQGRLHYRGLDNVRIPADVRRAFHQQQIAALTERQVLEEARRQIYDKGMSLGILEEGKSDDAARLIESLSAAKWDEHSGELVIEYHGATGEADRTRMLAILSAAKRRYDESPKASAGDEAVLSRARARIGQIEVALSNNSDGRAQAERQITQGPVRGAEADTLRKKADQLKAEFEALPQKTRALEKEITMLENLPSLAANPAVAADEKDPELMRLTEQLKSLNEGLNAALEASSTNAGDPKALLDAAQQQFDSQVAAARDAAAGNVILAGYLEKLQALQFELRRHNEELAQQQKDQREMLEKLRSRLAQETANRIQRAWDADPQLKKLVTRRAVVERQFNVASSAKLPEAKNLGVEMADLDKQIEALRGLIAAKDEYDPLTRQFLTFIDDSVKLVEQSRQRNEKRLKELFDAFVAAKPDMDKLPADQKARATALDEAYKSLSSARARYQAIVDETNARADTAVRGLTQQVAGQQAKVDARKRELAEARAAAIGDEPPPSLTMQEPERLAAIAQKRAALTEARQSEAKLQNEWAQTSLTATQARAEADLAEAARLTVEKLDAERIKLSEERHKINQDIASATGDPLATVAIAEIVPESAKILPGDDRREWYSFIAAAGGMILVLMALAASRSPGVYIPPVSRYEAYDEHYNEPQVAGVAAVPAEPFSLPDRRSA